MADYNPEGNYWHAMDKNAEAAYYFSNPLMNAAGLGISTPPMKDQLESLKAKVFQGAKHVELGFMSGPMQKGSAQGQISPEMHGRQEREAMKELARINKMSLSVHATPQMGGMTGLGQQGYSEETRDNNIKEVKRTIDFAADVAEDGGPIVVHAQEFPRPITEAQKDGKFQKFEGYKETDKTTHYLVDEVTGEIASIREDQKNFIVPREKERKESITELPYERAKMDEDKRIFKPETRTWNHYMEQANNDPDEAAKKFYQDKLDAEYWHLKGQADEYEAGFYHGKKTEKKIKEQLEIAEKYLKEGDKERLKKMVHPEGVGIQFVPPDFYDNPIHYLKEKLWETQRRISYHEEASVSARERINEIEDKQKRIKPMKDFSLEKTADGYAQLGVYAWKKEKDPSKPLFVAPENIFPEQYGGHPSELRDIIQKSRNKMVELLTEKEVEMPNRPGRKVDNPFYEKGVSKSKAEKIANEHIKATFDVAHANTWRKYFQGSDKDFNKWIMKEVDKLKEDGTLGHVHLSDNFGYVDDHNMIGEGNVPIKEFMEKLQKSDYKGKVVVEPGHFDHKSLRAALRVMDSPIYRIGGDIVGGADVLDTHSGMTYTPKYLFGEMAPNPKEWVLWSEVPME